MLQAQTIYYVTPNGGSYIIMNNGDELNVSKSKKEQLLMRLGVK
jgi:hypothetical protein